MEEEKCENCVHEEVCLLWSLATHNKSEYLSGEVVRFFCQHYLRKNKK
jgi:hypothetical protein